MRGAALAVLFLFASLTLTLARSTLELPGVSNVGSGYNLLGDDPTYPMQLGTTTLGAIFDDFTYRQNQTWTVHGQTYAIPDQLHVTRAQSFGVKTFTYQSVTDYLNQQASDFGLGLEYEFDVTVWKNMTAKIPLGASALATRLNQQMSESGAVLILATENIPLYDMQQFPGRNLSSAFVQRVQQLESNPDYASFLAQYGTHYQMSVEMGGQFSLFDVVSGTDSQFATSTTIQASVRLSFLHATAQLSPWSGTNKDNPPSYSSYLSSYRYGGDTSIPRTDYSQWVKSVPKSPVGVNRQLSSIVPLIRRVSSSVADGYTSYLKQAFASLQSVSTVASNNLPYLSYSPQWVNSGAAGGIITGISYFNDDDDHCQWCVWNVGSNDGNPTYIEYHLPSAISWSNTFGYPPPTPSPEEFRAPEPLRTKELVQESNLCGALYPCIPGLETMGLGFDIITGSSALPIFEWTFYQQNTWTSPFTGVTYSYPDQIILNAGGASQTVSYVYQSYGSYCYDSTDASSSGWDGYFFQLGQEYQSVRRAFDATQNVLGMTEESYVSHTLTLQPDSLLASAAFNRSLAALSSQYDPAAYAEFLSTWGTHYSSYGSYGGKAKLFSFIDQQAYMSSKLSSLQQQMTAQFENWKGGVAWGSSQHDAMWGFSTESFQWVTFYGGDATLALTNQWSDWVDTTRYAPAQVYKDLVPIWQLATDPDVSGNLHYTVNMYYNQVNTKPMPPPVSLEMSLGHRSGAGYYLLSDYGYTCTFDHGFGWTETEIFPTSAFYVDWYFNYPSGYMAPTIELQYVSDERCDSGLSSSISCPYNTFAAGKMMPSSSACGGCSSGLEARFNCWKMEIQVDENSW